MIKKIVLIGAGNVATHLGSALCGAGCDVVQVYSRTKESAMELADKLFNNGIMHGNNARNFADKVCTLLCQQESPRQKNS